jgi:hypothetical protein
LRFDARGNFTNARVDLFANGGPLCSQLVTDWPQERVARAPQ